MNSHNTITLDPKDPKAVMHLICSTPDGHTTFVAGWTDKEDARQWFEMEKSAHKNNPLQRIIEETPTRMVFEFGTARYVHELRPV